MVTEQIILKLLERISDPAYIVLLIVTYFLMKLINKRDQTIDDLTKEISANNKIMTEMATTLRLIFNKER